MYAIPEVTVENPQNKDEHNEEKQPHNEQENSDGEIKTQKTNEQHNTDNEHLHNTDKSHYNTQLNKESQENQLTNQRNQENDIRQSKQLNENDQNKDNNNNQIIEYTTQHSVDHNNTISGVPTSTSFNFEDSFLTFKSQKWHYFLGSQEIGVEGTIYTGHLASINLITHQRYKAGNLGKIAHEEDPWPYLYTVHAARRPVSLIMMDPDSEMLMLVPAMLVTDTGKQCPSEILAKVLSVFKDTVASQSFGYYIKTEQIQKKSKRRVYGNRTKTNKAKKPRVTHPTESSFDDDSDESFPTIISTDTEDDTDTPHYHSQVVKPSTPPQHKVQLDPPLQTTFSQQAPYTHQALPPMPFSFSLIHNIHTSEEHKLNNKQIMNKLMLQRQQLAHNQQQLEYELAYQRHQQELIDIQIRHVLVAMAENNNH